MVLGPAGVGSSACLFGCAMAGRASDWVAVPSWAWLGGGVGGWWLRPFRIVLDRALAGGFLLLRVFGVGVSVGPRVCFVLGLVLVSVFLGWCACVLGVFRAGRTAWCLGAGGGVCRPRAVWGPPVVSLLAVPGRLFCYGSLVVLDVARCCLWLVPLCMDMVMGKNGC